MSITVCRTRLLTPQQAEQSLARGLAINPANATEHASLAPVTGRRSGGRRLAVVIGRRWPAGGVRLTVQFLDNPSLSLRKRILLHMNAWGARADVLFSETTGPGEVRISRLDQPEADAGFWSYIGTEILGIEHYLPTMNLEGFTLRTAEAEFLRVVRHEAGHTLGFEHEHMRGDLVELIDRQKAIAHYRDSDGWSARETEAQVLAPLRARSIMGTAESDPHSIMCYQIPGAITKSGRPIPGGSDINERDHAFAARIYPRSDRNSADTEPNAAAQPQAHTLTHAHAQEKAAPPLAPGSPWLSGSSARPFASAGDDALHIVVMDGFDDATGERGSGATAAVRPTFARVFASFAGARVTQALQLRAPDKNQPTRFGRIIGMHERIKDYTNREKGSLPDDAAMMEFGGDLFETLFQGKVRRLYDEARSRQQGRKLDLILTSMIPWIAEKPWEFAYDHTRKSFLATEEVHFVRNAMAAVPAERIQPRAGPLRILVAAAQPVGFGRLSVVQESDVIRRGFEGLVAAGLVEIEVLARATPSSIQISLSSQPFDIVHFIGHGSFDEARGVGSLLFEDENGNAFKLEERPLRELFCGRGISLVFLNACQSGSGGRADFNRGVAQSLVSHGMPALVANQYSVLDSSATSFAQHFYWALAQGMGVGQAAREARIAVNCSMQGDLIDWAVPVVYARDPAVTLCVRRDAPDSPAAPDTPGVRKKPAQQMRAATAPPLLRVAVWDIDSVFPSLGPTLARMSAAQTFFAFERVNLSAPLDIWDLDQRAEDGTPYLWAEKLAKRLEWAAVGLGVNVLACITRHWMRSDQHFKLYGWWPPLRKPPVVITSLAGFESLQAEGAATDRALANLAVSALAGFGGQLDLHETGPRSCPMWFNLDRDIDHLSHRQRFDAKCRAHLRGQHGRELQAFDALLKAFP